LIGGQGRGLDRTDAHLVRAADGQLAAGQLDSGELLDDPAGLKGPAGGFDVLAHSYLQEVVSGR